MSAFEQREPSEILKEGSRWLRDRDARRNNLSAAIAASDLVRSTLGPRGFDKLLVAASGTIVERSDITDSDAIVCTNDGRSILEQANVNHPAARTLVEVAQSHGSAVPDGTTTAVVLAGELLQSAAPLFEQGAHPTEVIRGYQRAATRADDVITEVASNDDRLAAVAETALAGTILDGARGEVATVLTDGVRAVTTRQTNGVDVEARLLQVVSPPSSAGWEPMVARASVLDRTPVDPRMSPMAEGSILLVESSLALTDTEAVVEKSVEGWEGYEALVERDAKHAESRFEALRAIDPDVILCGEVIDDPTADLLARHDITAFECVPDDELRRLGDLFGTPPATDLDAASSADLVSGTVRQEAGMDGVWIEADDHRSSVVTLVVPEPAVSDTYHNVPKRIAEDTIDVLSRVVESGSVVPGGGAIEAAIATRLRDNVLQSDGREQLAFEAFADAVEIVPRQLADTAGMHATDALLDLRTAHRDGDHRTGIDARSGTLVDAPDAGIVDATAVKRQSVASAVEAVNRILKIDTVISEGADDDSEAE